MRSQVVLSFFDYTGHAVRDWARAGYVCYCFDIQHDAVPRVEIVGAGRVVYVRADLTPGSQDWQTIRQQHTCAEMVFGFPPCDDLACSGARHFKRKASINPHFQTEATAMAVAVEQFAISINAPSVVENPNSVLSSTWRKPDFAFDPCDFGGYLPEDDEHPRWPRYIAPRDAYRKRTHLWLSGAVKSPQRKAVAPEVIERISRSGRVIRGSRQFMLLGGSSSRTKNIRNETPRGFARAFFEANAKTSNDRR